MAQGAALALLFLCPAACGHRLHGPAALLEASASASFPAWRAFVASAWASPSAPWGDGRSWASAEGHRLAQAAEALARSAPEGAAPARASPRAEGGAHSAARAPLSASLGTAEVAPARRSIEASVARLANARPSASRRPRAAGAAAMSALPPSENPLLTRLGTGCGRLELDLPTTWARKLLPASISCLETEQPRGWCYSGFATLMADADARVAFAARPTAEPSAFRHWFVSNLLSSSGLVPQLFESQTYSQQTFLLTEWPGSQTLETILQSRTMKRHTFGRLQPTMSLGECLPVMVDLLRVVVSLEEAGVVLGQFSEETIYVTGLASDDTHALMTDFQSAHILKGALMNEVAPTGSALRDAPEMEEGRLASAASSIWQLGLIFARMLLGGDVPTRAVVERWLGMPDMSTPEGRKQIRDVIRQRFAVEEEAGFGQMGEEYADVLRIVSQMLHGEPAERWTSQQALDAIRCVALDRGVAIPSPRQVKGLPGAWQQL